MLHWEHLYVCLYIISGKFLKTETSWFLLCVFLIDFTVASLLHLLHEHWTKLVQAILLAAWSFIPFFFSCLSLAGSFFALCWYTILWLKLMSYAQVNWWCRDSKIAEKRESVGHWSSVCVLLVFYIGCFPRIFLNHSSVQYFPLLNTPTRPCVVLDFLKVWRSYL